MIAEWGSRGWEPRRFFSLSLVSPAIPAALHSGGDLHDGLRHRLAAAGIAYRAGDGGRRRPGLPVWGKGPRGCEDWA